MKKYHTFRLVLAGMRMVTAIAHFAIVFLEYMGRNYIRNANPLAA